MKKVTSEEDGLLKIEYEPGNVEKNNSEQTNIDVKTETFHCIKTFFMYITLHDKIC